MKEYKELFEEVKQKMQTLVSLISYELWISKLEIVGYKDCLIIAAPSLSCKKQIQKNHMESFTDSIKLIFGENTTFKLLDPDETEEYLSSVKDDDLQSSTLNQNIELPNFNSKFTFENFVVGKSNRFCYAGARAVAEEPGNKFNPLFIHGGVGLGKTHLLHAVGNYIVSHFPQKKVCYVTSEKFTNDYIQSISNIKKNGNVEFREKYRNLDILMVDDIQFIAGKESTQEEFFHTFNELINQNKQIILTSDRPISELTFMKERITSRFASGLVQDMQLPDFETRVAILRKKIQLEHYFIDDDVIDYIASNVETNIRVMEGLLSKIYFFATLLGKKSASMEEAKEAIKEIDCAKKESLTAEKIIQTVCSYFDITYSEITGKKKSKDIVEPRMIAIYLINEMLDIPLINIGKIFGGRDHTTIMHSRDKISESVKTNGKIKMFVNELKKSITQED